MARRNPSTPQWALTLLKEFSNGELQAGKFINKPRKLRDGTIKISSTRNRGTGIPASTWKRIKDGKVSPGRKTLAKLAKFKERYQYNKLKASGAPTPEAKKLSRSDFSTAMKQADEYLKRARKVARALSKIQNRKISYEWILYHMIHGDKDLEDWDSYVIALSG